MGKTSVMNDISEINLLFFKKISARYKENGFNITPIQGRIIMYIYENKDKVFQRDIEKFITCSKSTISNILNTMEKNKLIVRKFCDDDLRKNIICLSKKSLDIAYSLQQDKDRINQILCENVSDEEYNIFNEVFNKIKVNIERI